MEMRPVSSRNVAAVGYDPATQELRVRFNSGATYSYRGVPESTYRAMMRSGSIGSFIAAHVKAQFPFSKTG